jgi:Ran GTPase-activating protein (RanGAP) involved in mRNA processing and transport
MFKKKKVGKVQDMEDEEELDEEEEQDEDEEEEIEEKKEPQKLSPTARIISGKLLDDNVFEYTIITNKTLGDIGSVFDI